MKRFLAMLAALLACLPALRAATVYVKPGGTGDGSSWATAKGDLRAAIDEAADGDEIRAAQGVYYWDALLTLGKKKVTVIGGYEGVAETETPDSEAFRTIISGDVARNDRWVVHDLYERLYNGKTVTRDLGPMIVDGQLVVPEIEGEYEMALPDLYGKDEATGQDRGKENVSLFKVPANCDFTLKDIWVVGAGTVGQSTGPALYSQTSRLLLERVRFIGNRGHEGLLQLEGSHQGRTILKDCDFLWNYVTLRGIIRSGASDFVGEGIRIVGALQTGGQGSCGFFFYAGERRLFRDCWFEKCYASGRSWGPGGAVGGQGGNKLTIEESVFTNNFSGIPEAPAAVNFRYRDGNRDMVLRNCLITDNKTIQKCSSGAIVNLGAVAIGHDGATVEGCTFLGNTCDSIPSGSCKTIYAAPLMIVPRDSSAIGKLTTRSVVNCTFLGNKVTTSAGDNGAAITAARSILVNPSLANNPIDVLIANCTFAGDTPYPDVVWSGVDTGAKTRILDSIFWKSGDASAYVPFTSTETGVLSVDDCIVNGIDGLPSGIEGGGLVTADPLLGAPVFAEGHVAPVVRPGARIPGLRGGRDLVRFAVGNHHYFCYAEPLSHIADVAVEIPAEVEPFGDAHGVARPAGQSTKGAAQTLSRAAEEGWTVFLDVVPEGSGTLSGAKSTQVVAKGAPIAPVTANAASGDFVFEGWKDANGTVVSADPTLSIDAVTSDLALYATFRAPDVTWTFDLRGMGTFDDGSTVKTYTLTPGAPAPVPVYTIDESKCVPYGWDAPIPGTVGVDSLVFTFTYLEKLHRIVRVDTNVEGGTGDGSSWANAMTDIQAAIDLAGLWTGEVWIKRGVHRSGTHATDFLTMRNNVAIRGGFEGIDGRYATVDEERAARDTDRFETILTGDLDLDDYWKGTSGWQPYRVDGETLYLLDKEGRPTYPAALEPGDFYCQPHKVGTNISPIFDHAAAVLDQTAILDGITVMGGKVMDNNASAHPQMTNCTFLGSANFLIDDWMTFRDCTFSVQGVDNGVYLEAVGSNNGSDGWTLFENCLFRNCAITARGAFAVQKGNARLTGCRFVNCRKSGDGQYNAAAIGVEMGQTELFDCDFIDNLCTNGCRLVQVGSFGSVVSNCLFEGNQGFYTGNRSSTRGMVLSVCYNGTLKVFDSTFVSNTLVRYVAKDTGKGDTPTAIVLPTKGDSAIVNCTFEDNSVSVTSEDPARDICGATVAIRYKDTLGIVNSSFRNNAAPDGDLCLALRDGTAPVNVINSIFWSDAADYRFATKEGNDTAELNVLHSTAKGFDPSLPGLASHEAVLTSNPLFSSRVKTKGPLFARPLAGSSPAVHGGCDVFVDAKGTLCYLDDATQTYRDCLNGGELTPVEPLTPLADAFGTPRKPGRFAQGALQASTPARTLLMLR